MPSGPPPKGSAVKAKTKGVASPNCEPSLSHHCRSWHPDTSQCDAVVNIAPNGLKRNWSSKKRVVLLLPPNLGQGTMTRGNHDLILQGKDHLAHLFLGEVKMPWGPTHGASKKGISHQCCLKPRTIVFCNDKGKSILGVPGRFMHCNRQSTA